MARREPKNKDETKRIKAQVASEFKQLEPLKKMTTEELEVLLLEVTNELSRREGGPQAQIGFAGVTRILNRFYSGIYLE